MRSVSPRRLSVLRRRRLFALGDAALLLAFFLAGCRREPERAADVVARIGETEIHYAELEAFLAETLDEPSSHLDSAALSSLFDQMLDDRLLVALAIERGLPAAGANPRAAADHLLQRAGEPPISEAELEAFYAANADRFQRPERIHLRQILVVERDEAEAAMSALEAGEDFVAVSARVSQDPRASAGGDQGWLAPGDLPQMFADAVEALGPGDHSEIVPADYGYHIFQVVARAPARVVSPAEAAPEIRDELRRQKVDAQVAGFLEEARIRYGVEVYRKSFPFEYRGHYAPSPE